MPQNGANIITHSDSVVPVLEDDLLPVGADGGEHFGGRTAVGERELRDICGARLFENRIAAAMQANSVVSLLLGEEP